MLKYMVKIFRYYWIYQLLYQGYKESQAKNSKKWAGSSSMPIQKSVAKFDICNLEQLLRKKITPLILCYTL
jgi:hypothetical protein